MVVAFIAAARASVVQLAGFVDQHDRDAITDRIGKARLAADQFLRLGIVFQRPLGQRTDQDLQQLGIDGVVVHGVCPGLMGSCSVVLRSEEHTSELQSLMRISYAVSCLKKKKLTQYKSHTSYAQ